MRKLILLFTLIFTLPLISAPFREIDPFLYQAVQSIYKVPEARTLAYSLEFDGPITVRMGDFGRATSDAMWRSAERCILLNNAKRWTEGRKIASILFEMHNASINRELCYIDSLARSGNLSKEEYILTVERVEYNNVIKTRALIDKGISMGVFPKDAYFPVLKNFEDHLKLQQEAGHSAFIARNYERITH